MKLMNDEQLEMVNAGLNATGIEPEKAITKTNVQSATLINTYRWRPPGVIVGIDWRDY